MHLSIDTQETDSSHSLEIVTYQAPNVCSDLVFATNGSSAFGQALSDFAGALGSDPMKALLGLKCIYRKLIRARRTLDIRSTRKTHLAGERPRDAC
jgi:hypothetical protein